MVSVYLLVIAAVSVWMWIVAGCRLFRTSNSTVDCPDRNSSLISKSRMRRCLNQINTSVTSNFCWRGIRLRVEYVAGS